MREILTWAGVVLLIGVGAAFVFVEECEERRPEYGSSETPRAGYPDDSSGAGMGTGMGTGLGTGLGTGSGTGTGAGSWQSPSAPTAPPPTARVAEPPRPIRQPEVIRPGAEFVVIRRGEAMPRGTAAAPGDNLRVNVVVPEGETHYASLVAVSDGDASILLGDPASPGDPHTARGPFRFPGSLSLRPGGGHVRLLVVIRDERFTVGELLRETEAAVGRGTTPVGTVGELSVDLGR